MKNLKFKLSGKQNKGSNVFWLDLLIGLAGYLAFALGMVMASKGVSFIPTFIVSVIGMFLIERLYVEVRKDN